MANAYKASMNLPKTSFPMRASLATREPERLKAWEEAGVFELMLKKNEGHESFILHDGPPYANGPIHLGHALNKVSKDMINRYKSMRGYKTPYVPGWDCHGQPIEHKVEQTLGTKKFNETPTAQIREICRRYAVENIDIQKQGFKRLGVLAEWGDPYLTFKPHYDAADIVIFKKIFDTGAIYRGKKPVHWCSHCHTALAEAEIEYADEPSTSIFVAFEVTDPAPAFSRLELPVSIVIWTTTPWTLPANAGVALNPEARYCALEHEGRAYVVAADLAESFAEEAGWDLVYAREKGSCEAAPEQGAGTSGEDASTSGAAGEEGSWSARGDELLDTSYRHPIFANEKGRVILADYVSLSDGTGCVHTAPGHGADDFEAGLKFGLPITMPVDDDGRLYKGEGLGSGGRFGGLSTDEANPKIISWLSEQKTLLAQRNFTHSYPHCWRCKNPVIFRATSQWFVSMEKTGLRKKALSAINEDVRWYPNYAAKRISAMVEQRPDWCISRQRSWGVPIPAFTCADCGEININDEILDAVIELFKNRGSDAWFTDEPREYLGKACVCSSCESKNLKPGRDILDVWWDSGVSHTAVLDDREYLRRPADMYLEGSDQHRGWFQSSLLTSIGAYGIAPYKSVVSQGFALDGKGRKMSKSLGNVIDPNKVCAERGADIIRLWVASTDTTGDVACDATILDHVGDAYRRFRNTFRFLLGELEDQFDPEPDALPLDELEPYDQLILSRAFEVHNLVEAAYEDYRFNVVYRLLYDFVTTDLSNGYLNATKDRMYCEAPRSRARLSAQTCWAELTKMLLCDLQPILVYTCDELMEHLPSALRQNQDFAALLSWYEPAPLANFEKGRALYARLTELRGLFTRAYETALADGKLADKTTQAARVRLGVTREDFEAFSEFSQFKLEEAFVCSSVELVISDEPFCEVEPARGERCERCWNWRDLDSQAEASLCERCSQVFASQN